MRNLNRSDNSYNFQLSGTTGVSPSGSIAPFGTKTARQQRCEKKKQKICQWITRRNIEWCHSYLQPLNSGCMNPGYVRNFTQVLLFLLFCNEDFFFNSNISRHIETLQQRICIKIIQICAKLVLLGKINPSTISDLYMK